MYDPSQENIQWTETPSNVSKIIMKELKSIGVVVRAKYFTRFVEEIAKNYNDLPFHNFKHASHVTLMTLWILKKLRLLISSNDFEYFALSMVVVALCHDLNHNGSMNSRLLKKHVDNLSSIDIESQFIMSSSSDNENMHASCLLELLKKYGNKISLKYDLNANMIFFHNCILATDLIFHERIMQHISHNNRNVALKSMIQRSPVSLGMLIIKCADLGHFICHPAVHIYWVCKLEEEILYHATESKLSSIYECERSICCVKRNQKSYLTQLSETTMSFCNRYVKLLLSELFNLLRVNSEQVNKNKIIWASLLTKTNITNCKTYIDRMSSEVSDVDPTNRNNIEKHENVCICMIDIVNFTQWSNHKHPEDIFETMSLYNEYIIDLIEKESDVEKIEMVGDSIMIIGGLRSGCKMNTKLEMFCFVSKLLNGLDRLKRIFSDGNISLRVGMHIGNIYIGCVKGPLRIQVFGNSICVASRMESSAFPGTLMISDTLFDAIHFYKNKLVHFALGNIVNISLKGVGNVNSMCIFPKAHTFNILIADDLKLATKMICEKVKKLVPKSKIKLVNDLRDFKETLFMTPYDIIFSDRYFQNGETVDYLVYEYRLFEEKYRTDTARIVVYSTDFETEYGREMLGSLLDSNDVIARTDIFDHLEYILKETPCIRKSIDECRIDEKK